MKWRKLLFIVFTIFLTVWNGGVSAFAMNTGFSTNEMNSKDQLTFLSNINLSLITNEPQKSSIACFDVSNNGLIAIGSETSEKNFISVYDATGEFKYGYVFNCNQSFGVQWDGINLMIYFVRSDVAALFDPKGVNIELRTIEDTIDNNSYWNHTVFSKEKTVNGNRYTIKNTMGLFNIFASSYSQLIETDSDGNETIIYDFSTSQTTRTILIFIAVFTFVTFVIAIIIWQFLKAKRNTGKVLCVSDICDKEDSI